MNITEDIVLNTVIDVQPEHMYELQAAPARIFGLLVLELICKRVLLPTYGCQDFTPEKHGCDVVLKQCTQAPLCPEACLESKYVENFWLKEGTLLQQVKDAMPHASYGKSKRTMWLIVFCWSAVLHSDNGHVPAIRDLNMPMSM